MGPCLQLLPQLLVLSSHQNTAQLHYNSAFSIEEAVHSGIAGQMSCHCRNQHLTKLIFVASKLTQCLSGILVLILLCHDLVLSPFFQTLFYISSAKTSQIFSCIWTTLNKKWFSSDFFFAIFSRIFFPFQSHHVYTNR